MQKLKISRRIKTVNDLLARSDVNNTLEDFIKRKVDVVDLMIVYTTAQGEIRMSQSGIEPKDMMWMLQKTAQTILREDEDQEED